MTRFCYVVLAHKEPQQVVRLVRRIRALSPSSHVLVRHDCGPELFGQTDLAGAGAGELSSDISVSWGDWSMVEATLEALAVARERFAADWLVVISGQDYPLRPLATWEQEVASGPDDVIVDCWDEDPAPRATLRWRRLAGGRSRLPTRAKTFLQRAYYVLVDPYQDLIKIWPLPRGLGWAVGLPRRERYPTGLRHQKGSQFLTASGAAVDEVLAQHAEDPSIGAYFATTFIPDESYLQTLFVSTPSLQVARRRTTHAEFVGESPHAALLDLPAAVRASRAGVPFGRKIEPGMNSRLSDELDEMLDRGELW